ncbi:triple tyrosine motif-containing protein [Hathewaya limosa]|uniref:Two component regulator three Y domain-containing protein n=1 Tax=Hathewaya limosa TaxID=1536 RepID=A0ABU0JSH8_HATLI|nr:triple tyrosine motif-containing protein [Hathewaya limosa]MDQ0479034.1 hypothetical protein [Hathewaya limosa]
MNELLINFEDNKTNNDQKTIGIFVETLLREELLYKFLEGRNGMWKVIKDFGKENYISWKPQKEGNYIIMVQGKKVNGSKPFDYLEREEYSYKKDLDICKNIEVDEYIEENSNMEIGVDLYNEKGVKQREELHINTIANNSKEILNQNIEKSKIKYILTSPNENHVVDEEIMLALVIENAQNTLIKYKLYINNIFIEEKAYDSIKSFVFRPRIIGEYRIEFYSKHRDSEKEFDSKKDYKFEVKETSDITDITVNCNENKIVCNKDVTFNINVQGGKSVIYEFYLLKDQEWKMVQGYGAKSFYTFTPFKEGIYDLLVLAKSAKKDIDYEKFTICKFEVEKQIDNIN